MQFFEEATLWAIFFWLISKNICKLEDKKSPTVAIETIDNSCETKVCKSEKIMTVMNFASSPSIYIGMKFQSRINDRGSPLKRTRIHERYERGLTCPALCILLLLSLSSVSCRAHLLLPSFWVSTCRREGRGSSLTSSMLFATRKRNTAAPRCLTLFIP